MTNKIITIGDFNSILSSSSPEIQSIAHQLRALIAEVMPTVTEVVWEKQKIAGYGIGPKKMSQHFAYIALNKKYVNLGFMYGSDLPDPSNLLQGNGKKLRHIKIIPTTNISNPSIKDLLVAASQHPPNH